MDVMMIVAICGLALICCGVSVKIAAGKGRSPLVWGLLGLVLNLVGLLAVVVVPRHHDLPSEACGTTEAPASHGARAAVA